MRTASVTNLVSADSMSAPVSRTTVGLRTALLDELDAIRSGSSNPSRANAVARVVGGVVETLRVELEMKKYLSGNGKGTATSLGQGFEL